MRGVSVCNPECLEDESPAKARPGSTYWGAGPLFTLNRDLLRPFVHHSYQDVIACPMLTTPKRAGARRRGCEPHAVGLEGAP